MNSNSRTGSIRVQHSERKIEPPLIFEINKPDAIPASAQRQVNTAARSQHKVIAVRVIVGKMKVPIANKNFSICRQPSSAIWKFSPNKIGRLMSAHLFVNGKKTNLSLVANSL